MNILLKISKVLYYIIQDLKLLIVIANRYNDVLSYLSTLKENHYYNYLIINLLTYISRIY